jgi:hypothetical protein
MEGELQNSECYGRASNDSNITLVWQPVRAGQAVRLQQFNGRGGAGNFCKDGLHSQKDFSNALVDGSSGPPKDLFGSFAKALRRFHSRNSQRQ